VVLGLLLAGCGPSDRPERGDGPAPDAFSDARTRASWNPHVRCRATVTRLHRILGSQRSGQGGATFNGGGFRPGIPDKRAFRPPCRVRRVPTFVQLNRVRVGSCDQINNDGDWTCTLTDPRSRTPRDMRSIHIETDRAFRARHGWSVPPGGTTIKVQGFVYWDPGHTTAAWHNHSGWELHSFTAWRRVR
jgi:hypothetical protein